MSTLNIELPEDVLLGSGQSRADFVREARFLLMSKLFELGRISSGKASLICGMPRLDFLLGMNRLGVPTIQLDRDELRQEIEDAQQ